MPPTQDELKKLLEETRAIAAENNRLLHEMRRFAILGFVAKTVLWLVVLGVPLFFLSTYLGPLLEALSAQAQNGTLAPGAFAVPSEAQLRELIELYRAGQ